MPSCVPSVLMVIASCLSIPLNTICPIVKSELIVLIQKSSYHLVALWLI